jgi:hypothetical protein
MVARSETAVPGDEAGPSVPDGPDVDAVAAPDAAGFEVAAGGNGVTCGGEAGPAA